MLQSESVTILVVNAIAEEIKQVTLHFRRFLPNCRVEAVYTIEEALQWGQRASWQLIVIDGGLLSNRAVPVISELKRCAPSATLVLQTDHSVSATALHALPEGADFLLDKRSPIFLTELVLYAKGAIETRAIRRALDQIQERHSHLIEILSDGFYELDSEGRFVYLSPLVTELLGYTQDELIGIPYSAVVPPDQQDRARHRFNDRRAGMRATRRIEIDLLRKTSADAPAHTRVRAEISARGLYDNDRRHLGTLGLLRDLSQHRRQTKTIDQLEHQLRESDRLLASARRLSTVSKNLQPSHNAILAQSQLLLKTIHDAHLIEQVDSLATYVDEALHLGNELIQTTAEIVTHRTTINDILEAVLTAAQPSFTGTDWIERAYGQNLPPLTARLDSMMDLLRMLLSHARRYMATVGFFHRLRISTRAVSPHEFSVDQETRVRPPTTNNGFEIHIQETDIVTTAEEPLLQTTGGLLEAYAMIKRLGGHWEFLVPASGLLSIKMWIPVEEPSLLDSPTVSSIPLASSARIPVEQTTDSMRQEPVYTSPIVPSPTVHQTESLPDRRRCIRTIVNLPARITIGTAMHEGVLIDLSPSGATLEIEGVLASFEQQPVYLLIRTPVSILELDATAQDRGHLSRKTDIMRPTSRLALEFTALEESQQKILASFVEAARMRALVLTVEAQFPSLDRIDDFAATFMKAGLSGTDHRETVRVRVVLPVQIELPNASLGRLSGVVVNFSRGGLCLQTEPFFNMIDETITLRFTSVRAGDQPRHQKPEMPDVILTGRIVHLTLDSTVSPKLTPSSPQPVQRVGLRFSNLTPFAEREVNRVLAQHIGSSIDVGDLDSGPSIVSDRWECHNTKQQVIAVTADHVRHQISTETPIILLIPGFGSTQTDYVPLSFYLAANHMRVLRYDHSNHVGQSEGNILHITLSHMQADLRSVLDFIRHTWPTASVTLLAEDVAARVAVRVMAERRSADQIFLLNPVLNIDIALSIITRSNAIATYRQGQWRGIINLWGHNVDFDQFLGDAIREDYVDSASSTAELTQLVTPPVILTSPRKNRPIEHPFGPQQHTLRATGSIPTVVSLPADVTGESGTNDERRTTAFKTILTLITTSRISSPPSTHLLKPNLLDVYRQRRLEHERIRTRHHVSQTTRSALWGTHLAHLSQLENLPDYFALTNDFYRWLLPLEPGMTVLDIGCGQRNFHRLLQTNQAYRSTYHSRRTTAPLRYVGLDQSHESLRLAEQQIHLFGKELPSTLTPVIPPTQLIVTRWLRTDWNVSLPFIDGSIERILCHLPLSFTPSPLHCLRQMLRVLHPDGTAVVTCFQPHTDLSTLFRHHLHTANHDEPGSPSQIVLHYLGRLREAILHGFVHTYEHNEFASLLAHAGGHSIQLFSVLDNQLLLAIVRKTKSAG